MSTEPEQNPRPTPPKLKRPRGKPVNDGFVVFDCDGFAQMTPEQRTWPVVTPEMMTGKVPPPVRRPAAPPEKPPGA